MIAGSVVGPLVLSLVGSEVAVNYNPSAAFYLLPYRAFELMLGSVIALPGVRFPRQPAVAAGVTSAGLVLLAAALIFVNTSSRFPGLLALLPTVGAALIIWGSFQQDSSVRRCLEQPVLVFLGRISYSLYLVHWPLIVFASRLSPYANPYLRALCIVALAVALAYASFRFVEQPFRTKAGFWTTRKLFLTAGGGLAVVAALSGFVLSEGGFASRLDPVISNILSYQSADFRSYFRSGVCFLDPEQRGADLNMAKCVPGTHGKLAVLWGDSAVADLYEGMHQPMKDAGYDLGQLTASGCPPTLGVDFALRPNCRNFNEVALSEIVKLKPDLVIIGSEWPASAEVLAGVDRAVAELQKVQIKPVIFGAPILYRAPVPQLLAERLRAGIADTYSGKDLEISYMSPTEKAM